MVATFDGMASSIYTQFKSVFGAARPTVPIAWDEVAHTPPDSGAWVRGVVDCPAQVRAALGVRKWRTAGLVTVQVFTPQGLGGQLSRQLAEDVATAFRGINLSGIRLRAPSIVRVGVDGQWFQTNVLTEFVADHTE